MDRHCGSDTTTPLCGIGVNINLRPVSEDRESVAMRAALEPIRIEPINGMQDLRQFIRIPWSIYVDDPVWIPHLLLERQEQFSRRHPYFAHARCCFWVAYRGKTPVGRISAQIDTLHEARYRDATGFFGLLEAEDAAETFHELLSTAESWLRDQGMVRIRGPFNLSINQESGLLVEGYETPPMIMMGHARPYYAGRLEAEGYQGVKDLLAYRIATNFTPPDLMRTVVAKAAGAVRIRPMRRSSLDEDLTILQEIYEDAWSTNWGFIPFTEEEFQHLGRSLRLLVDDEYVQIAEVDGVPAAMMVAFPNVNEAIADLNGRLLPLGWLKLLWRLKVRHPKTARVALMGVRKCFQRTAMGTALAFMLIDAVRSHGIRRGVQAVELSWVLEDNIPMRNILTMLGGVPYKRYRIYEKGLS